MTATVTAETVLANNNARRFQFFGTLPNGKHGLIVTLTLPGDHQEAARVMARNPEITSYRVEGDRQGDLFESPTR